MDALEERLARLEEAALTDAALFGVREGLDMICMEARALCPQDTGALRDSIGVRMTAEGGEVFSALPYAARVEMGSAGQRAQPFLFPAMRARGEAAAKRVSAAVIRRLG